MSTEQEDVARAREMIARYCRKQHKHKDGLCPECEATLAYVAAHRHRCPWGDDKPACGMCKHNCYSPQMRETMKQVMIANIPHMLAHPISSMRNHGKGSRDKKK